MENFMASNVIIFGEYAGEFVRRQTEGYEVLLHTTKREK